MEMKVEVRRVSELAGELAEEVRCRNDREFGNDSLVYDKPEWYLLGLVDGELVCHVGFLQRTIAVAGKPLAVGGACYLVTDPERRGQGLGFAMMQEASRFMKEELKQSFGLLTCRASLEDFYGRSGWRAVPGPTVFAQNDGTRLCRGLTMVLECGDEVWPAGEIDLCGLPW